MPRGTPLSSQLAWLFAASLRQIPSLLTLAFSLSNFRLPARSRAFRSAAISRPIRFSSPCNIARRYRRPLQLCNARSKFTPTVLRGSFRIVLLTLMGQLMFVAVHLPAATVFPVHYHA